MNEQEYIRKAEALKQKLYRAAVLYLGSEDYPWDTVELELDYTSLSVYQQPVYVPMTPQR